MSADLDVALITQPERNPKLTMTKLAETPLHIVVPREHNLASKSAIKLADLRDERWIIYQQRTHPLLYERIVKLMRMSISIRSTLTGYSTRTRRSTC